MTTPPPPGLPHTTNQIISDPVTSLIARLSFPSLVPSRSGDCRAEIQIYLTQASSPPGSPQNGWERDETTLSPSRSLPRLS